MRVSLCFIFACFQKSLNFLSTIPHTSEVINITAGYINDEEQRSECNGKLEEVGSENTLARLISYEHAWCVFRNR